MKTVTAEDQCPEETADLEDLIVKLVELESRESPLISCYIDLAKPPEVHIRDLAARGAIARSGFRGQALDDFDNALDEILDYLRRRKPHDQKSMAIFSRVGDEPVFLTMSFSAPLESQLFVDPSPMIYPLVALKDKLHRFVVVITSEAEARILEVVIGQVTESMLTKQPALRKRVGREWTKHHFQSHKRDRHSQFIKEKVALIEELMGRKGYNHLIIAGSGPNIAQLTSSLPKRIRDLVIDPKNRVHTTSVNKAVAEAIRLFVEQEERESQSNVEKLHAAIMTNGLGVAGGALSLQALVSGQADLLIILDSYPPDEREVLVRAAVQAKVDVETVSESDLLGRYGGVGCLLRYLSTA